LVTSVRGIAVAPTTAANIADGVIGFMNAAFGLRFTAGLAAFLATGFLAAGFLAAGFFAAGAFATLAAGFFAAGFLATGFFATFAAGFFAAGFFAAGFFAAMYFLQLKNQKYFQGCP
jgi:hypothetical protein